MAEEPLHDHILRLAFLADPQRPVPLSTEDYFWKLGQPHLPLAQIKECLEWLVRRGDLALDRSKYILTPARFFELKSHYGHLGPQGIAVWLAPIAPIRIPLPIAPAEPAPIPEKVVAVERAPVVIPEPVVAVEEQAHPAPIAPAPVASALPVVPAPPQEPVSAPSQTVAAAPQGIPQLTLPRLHVTWMRRVLALQLVLVGLLAVSLLMEGPSSPASLLRAASTWLLMACAAAQAYLLLQLSTHSRIDLPNNPQQL